MPKIVGARQTVVDDGAGLTIAELVGNVASGEDRISIAHVKITSPSSEPWLTLLYDEWICVLAGRMVLLHADGKLEVQAGEAVFIERGERFRPTFPDGGTEYIPVCLPAFRPDRCIREDDSERSEAVSTKLGELHAPAPNASPPTTQPNAPSEDCAPEVLYHMCPVPAWSAAKESGEAYYPATFADDGHYTHATGVPSRLIETANHFYQGDENEWVCLRLSRSALRRCGIFVRDEKALPVGTTPVSSEWGEWICPHIIGGIPVSVVDGELPMVRRPLSSGKGAEFISIEGVTPSA